LDDLNKTSKAQVWTIDFLAGATAMSVILLFFILLWNNSANRWNNANEYRMMLTDAVFASEALIATPGEPENWEMFGQINNSNISAIGLADGRNELNVLKIEKLVSQNSSSYSFVRQRLGLQKYEFGFRVTDLKKNVTYYQYGQFAGGLNKSVIFDRIGIINGSAVILHMEVWK